MKVDQRLKALIVDDDTFIGNILRSQLEKIGHDVVGHALDGKQAVALTLALCPDVVLMDLVMPVMDGLEATKKIHDYCPCPVIILTNNDSQKMVRLGSIAGASGYLVKPANLQELDRTIAIAVARFEDFLELQRLNNELSKATDNIKLLTGLLPICSDCKKIRNEKGYWQVVEGYIMEHTHAKFSHGICPECMEKQYPEYITKIKSKQNKCAMN